MTTITKTTAQAVSRKLSSLNFDRKYSSTEYGFSVYLTEPNSYFEELCVTNLSVDNGYRSTIAEELKDAGYAIEVVVDNAKHNGKILTSLVVLGKVGA